MLPRCLAVLLLASVAVRDVTFAAKLRLSLPERLDVTEGVSLTINCSFSPPPTDPNHVIVKWSVLPAFYSKNTPIGDVIQIYNSGVDVVGVGVAALVGDVVKGDCSVRLRRISAGLGPVIGCMVVCGRCNTEDVAVAREATLNVTVAADERGSAPILVPECLLMSDAVSAECRFCKRRQSADIRRASRLRPVPQDNGDKFGKPRCIRYKNLVLFLNTQRCPCTSYN
ncbi:uncharacterized protein LOC142917868 isoform X4 [Petromyzon marinus]|uniref:uncharacterized protein LOC142917868 isoform X4 n=1 Tax=Petromyzon marinus TaxID=7757 RepID=UPI003F71586A